MSRSYAFEKFYAAITGMATSPASLQERVADAYLSSIMRVEVKDLPAEFWTAFKNLETRLTKEEPIGEEGIVAATVARMSIEEAEELAQIIYRIFDHLAAVEA